MARKSGSWDLKNSTNPAKEITGTVFNLKHKEKNKDGEEAFKKEDQYEGKPNPTESSSTTLFTLKKELGLLEAVGVITGCVVGSGIFASPSGVLQYSGSVGASLVVWAASGLLSLLGALTFAELGTMIPESGGLYSYLHHAFGPLPAFIYMWVCIFVRNPASIATKAIIFGQYLLQLFFADCEDVTVIPERLLATVLICFLTWVNCVNMPWVTKIQNVFMVAKVGALVVIIVAGMWRLVQGHVEHYAFPWAGSSKGIAPIALAFYQSMFTYSGWNNLNSVTEELKNPNRNLPLSIILSLTTMTIVYTMVNGAYFAVLTQKEMLSSGAVAMAFGVRVLGMMAWVMPVFVMLSTFGSTHSAAFTLSRIAFFGARRGHLPSTFGLISTKNYTPVLAVIFTGLMSIVLLLVPNIVILINYTVFSDTCMEFACTLALLWCRYKHPEWPRPFKVWLVVPILFAGVQILLLVVPLLMAPMDVAGAVGIILVGCPVYYFAVYRQELATIFSGMLDKFTIVCQKVFVSAAEERLG